MNYISEQELNTIKGLLHYLNESLPHGHAQIDVEAELTDANGESLGSIRWEPNTERYVLVFAS